VSNTDCPGCGGKKTARAKTCRSCSKRGRPITALEREVFLQRLREGDSPEAAGRAAGRSRQGFQGVRQHDETFALEWAAAEEAGVGMIEQQLVAIARGEVEAKNNAQVTAIFGVLRARRPEIWRERYVEPDRGKPRRIDTSNLSKEELALFRELLLKVRGGE
jgi:hypothetical protein